ncbi:flagellar hook-basal body complex protein FliE [Fulvimonas sp. R45]|uniref:flagellar hook-basal body complex protein FliE n=1 Tax=Fulvimonas sp. R45 TaxID=3045937 RepID=UPI00265FF3A1|nr:flagellar hook-basal body complex protein FliE [Fulvimonas sp. R45]MDO1528352.1 flagellar hook-basal body complex protein FliE [Fulvimonas sp. R45]
MSRIDVDNLLSQMRQMTAQIQTPRAAPEGAAGAPAQGGFGALLRHSIADVAQNQLEAGRLAAGFERGVPDADLGRTMVAIQKAQLSLSAMNQVRNKLVDAYRDVMNMPI